MIAVVGKILWALGIVAWYLIRHRFERKAKRVRVVRASRSASERIGLVAATAGLGVIPAFYVITGAPRWADYLPRIWMVAIGAIIYAGALWLFRRSHKDLGRQWSASLEIRESHQIVRIKLQRDHPWATALHAALHDPLATYGTSLHLGQI